MAAARTPAQLARRVSGAKSRSAGPGGAVIDIGAPIVLLWYWWTLFETSGRLKGSRAP
jgi:hypothetical protein